MQIPAKISFLNLDPSDALRARINEKIAKINFRYPDILGFHVIVEAAHRHQQKGRLYSVRIDATLPGSELVVSHHPGKNPRKHDKVFAAMNNAFVAIERQLSRSKDVRRQNIKIHQDHFQPGVISNFFSKEGYGFISTIAGEEIYFHQNAVENEKFLELDIGSHVRFVEATDEGRKGPQASIVRLTN